MESRLFSFSFRLSDDSFTLTTARQSTARTTRQATVAATLFFRLWLRYCLKTAAVLSCPNLFNSRFSSTSLLSLLARATPYSTVRLLLAMPTLLLACCSAAHRVRGCECVREFLQGCDSLSPHCATHTLSDRRKPSRSNAVVVGSAEGPRGVLHLD